MPQDHAPSQGILDDLPFYQWCLTHRAQFPVLRGLLKKMKHATTPQDKWSAAKEAGDLLVFEMLVDFPPDPDDPVPPKPA